MECSRDGMSNARSHLCAVYATGLLFWESWSWVNWNTEFKSTWEFDHLHGCRNLVENNDQSEFCQIFPTNQPLKSPSPEQQSEGHFINKNLFQAKFTLRKKCVVSNNCQIPFWKCEKQISLHYLQCCFERVCLMRIENPNPISTLKQKLWLFHIPTSSICPEQTLEEPKRSSIALGIHNKQTA